MALSNRIMSFRRCSLFATLLLFLFVVLVCYPTTSTGSPVAVRAKDDSAEESSTKSTSETKAKAKAKVVEKEKEEEEEEEKKDDDEEEKEEKAATKKKTVSKSDDDDEDKEDEDDDKKKRAKDDDDDDEKDDDDDEKEIDPDVLAAQKKKAASANAAARDDEDDEEEEEDKDAKKKAKTKKTTTSDTKKKRTDVFGSGGEFEDDVNGKVFEGAAKNTNPDKKSKCFPAGSRVTLADGSQVPIERLVVGDVVHVGAGRFSPVFMFTHKDEYRRSRFLRLRTAAGPTVTVTAGHYMPISGKGLVAAAAISVGDHLTLAETQSTSPVVAVDLVVRRGLYNPQTLHGDIAVDGVVASTYTTAVAPAFAHMALAPFRALFRLFGASTGAFESSPGLFEKVLPRGSALALMDEL